MAEETRSLDRRRVLAIGATAIGVVLLIVLVWFWLSGALDLSLVEIDATGPLGNIVAFTENRLFWWDGDTFSWTQNMNGRAEGSLALSQVRSVIDVSTGSQSHFRQTASP